MPYPGIIYALLAHDWWGVSPLYWRLLEFLPPLEIITHRALWALPLFIIFLGFKHKLNNLKLILQAKVFMMLSLSAILVGINWLAFVWAIVNERLLEASFAYFIYPLVMVGLGVIFLKERPGRAQILALLLVLFSVIMLFIERGPVSWVVLVIVCTFAAYTYIHKISGIDAATALSLETIILLPLAPGYMYYLNLSGTGEFNYFAKSRLVPIAGLMTALPLLWMISVTKLLDLTTLGIWFYLNPSLQFVIGVVVFKEPLSLYVLACFGLIWLAIIIYTVFAAKKK